MGNCLESISQWCECEKGDEDDEENRNIDARSRHSRATVAHIQQSQKQKSALTQKQINSKNKEAVKYIQQQHPSSHGQAGGQVIQPRRIKLISQASESEENSLNTTNIIHDTSQTGMVNYTHTNNNMTMLNNQTTIIQEEEEQDSDHILSMQINQKQQKEMKRCNTANNINPKMKIQSENIKQLLQRCKTGNILSEVAQENRRAEQQDQTDQVEKNDNLKQQEIPKAESNQLNEVVEDISLVHQDNSKVQMDSFDPKKFNLKREESLSQNSYTNNMMDDSLMNFRKQGDHNNQEKQIQQDITQCKQTIGRLLKLRFELLQKKKAELERNEVNFDSSLDQQIESNNTAIANQQKYFQQLLEKRDQFQQQQQVNDQNNLKNQSPSTNGKEQNSKISDQSSKKKLVKVANQIILQNGVTKQFQMMKNVNNVEQYQNENNLINKQIQQKNQQNHQREQQDNQSTINRQDIEQIEYFSNVEQNFRTPSPMLHNNQQNEKQFLRQRNGTSNITKMQQTINTNTANRDGYNNSLAQNGNQVFQHSKTLGFNQNNTEVRQPNTIDHYSRKDEAYSQAQQNNYLSKKNSLQNKQIQQGVSPLKKGKSIKNNSKLDTFIFMGEENENEF